MYRIIILDDVYDDINRISDYIIRFYFTKQTARKITNELFSEIFSLKVFPLRYQKYYKEYYAINLKSYRIFYLVDDKNKIVTIMRVFGTAQDFSSQI